MPHCEHPLAYICGLYYRQTYVVAHEGGDVVAEFRKVADEAHFCVGGKLVLWGVLELGIKLLLKFLYKVQHFYGSLAYLDILFFHISFRC